MDQKTIIPELNYWIREILLKTPINEKFFQIPSKISNFWKESNSVLDLLFNENFKSTISINDDLTNQDPPKQYIYSYRTCDIKKIEDKSLVNRLNIYRYHIDIYAADSDKYLSIFDQTDSPNFINQIFENENIQDHLEMQNRENDIPDTDYSQEMDEKAQKNPYLTYKSKIYNSTNYQLVKFDDDYVFDPPPVDPILPPLVNIFDFTDQEFEMLDLLFFYKTTDSVDISHITCESLTSPLSKCIFIYLSACLGIFDVCPSSIKFSDGTNLLHSVYEKYVLDFVYRMKQKEYIVVYKPTENINNKNVQINQDFLLPLTYKYQIMYLTPEQVTNKKIILDDEFIPWDRVDFNIYHNSYLLKQDTDYTVEINIENTEDINYQILLLKNDFVTNDKLICVWSYLVPTSAYSRERPEELYDPRFNPSNEIEGNFSKIENLKNYVT